MNIIITGASSGVGFEAVLELAQSNDHSILAIARSRNKLDKLQSLARALNPECDVEAIDFDIVKGNYVTEILPLIRKKFNAVDILINNAGILINRSFEQSSGADFLEMFHGNVLGHVNMIKACLPVFSTNSHIVNIGSMGGYQGSVKFPGLSAYSTSKAALHTLTECLAIELAHRHIKVNCLALGSAQTEMLETAFPDYQSPVMAFEMGKFIAEFALNGHKFFNGKILPVASTTP